MSVKIIEDLSVLRKMVQEAPVGGARLNDLEKGSYVKIKTITQEEGADGVVTVVLQVYKDDKATKTIRASLYAFATMRLSDLTGDTLSSIVTTQDATASNDVFTVQDTWNDSADKVTKAKKFTVINTLTIPNNFAKEQGAVVLRDICYSGYSVFAEMNASIWANEEKTIDQKLQERNGIRNTMLGTAVREGMNVAKNYVTVPLFKVSE